MSPYGYVQIFLFGLFCIGAINAETATCTPRSQRNIDLNHVNGDWFLAKFYGPINITLNKGVCYPMHFNKINETTIDFTVLQIPFSKIHTIEDIEDPGTWQIVGEFGTLHVVYMSADGTTMMMSRCMGGLVEPFSMLIGKQLPISSEKIEEALQGVEQAGHRNYFTAEAAATCPSP